MADQWIIDAHKTQITRWRLPCSPRRSAALLGTRLPVILFWCGLIGLTCCVEHDPDATTQRVVLGGQVFDLELALDQPARYQGLSDRPQIADHGGMLFVFPQPQPLQFVMRRCLVPIDLIFLGPGGRVITTHRMAVESPETPEQQLRRYASTWPAQFVIELKGGVLDQLDLKPGMKIELPIDTLKRRAR